MSDDQHIAAVAEELIALHLEGRCVPPFTSSVPGFGEEQGYAVARRVHEKRVAAGWRIAGRKIGFTNRTIWPRYGVYRPIWGYVYDRTLVRADNGRATVSLAGLAQPRIEPEICFGLRATPPVTHDPEALLGAIDWVAHSVEIVQCLHPGWKLKIADCTADNGLHGRLVVGTPIPVRELPGLPAKLPALKVELRKGAAVVDHGVGSNVLDSPLEALAFLAEVLSRQVGASPLRGGEIVSTGTLTDAHPVAPGETWSTSFDGLPLRGLEVSFT